LGFEIVLVQLALALTADAGVGRGGGSHRGPALQRILARRGQFVVKRFERRIFADNYLFVGLRHGAMSNWRQLPAEQIPSLKTTALEL